MITSKEPETTLHDDAPEIRLDPTLLRSIIRRRRGSWIALGLLVFGVLLAYGLFVTQQNYTAVVSISMQRPSASPSPLAALAGVGGGGPHYLGILHSRRFAEEAEKVVHLRQLYAMPQEEVPEFIQRSLKIDDNATDGLLYITATLPSLPRFAPDPDGKRERIKFATAALANQYAVVLQNYLETSDTDRDLSLLRGAEGEMKKVRHNYNLALEQSFTLIKTRTPRQAGSVGSEGASTSDSAPTAKSSAEGTAATGQLSGLYTRSAGLKSQINGLDARRKATEKIVAASPDAIASIPGNDILLQVERQRVTDARAAYNRLSVQFTETQPAVVRAKQQVKLADEELISKASALRKGNTSDAIQRQALQAEYDTVQGQIADAERAFASNRNLGTEIEKRRNEVLMALEELKTTRLRYAELRLQTVSGKNRMAVIDPALPPRWAKPGILQAILIGLLGALLSIGAWLVVEYLLLNARRYGRGGEGKRFA